MEPEANRLLLCTDLDRTLLPNGPQPESEGARQAFKNWVYQHKPILAFVSGRRLALQEAAIDAFDLPWPAYAITDVGAALYCRVEHGWEKDGEWDRHLAACWGTHSVADLADGLADLSEMVLQDAAAQAPFKLSFEVEDIASGHRLVEVIKARLAALNVDATVVWSVDETEPMGLLDVLPARAGKLNAVRWLAVRCGLPLQQVLYAGDSGNDLEVLASEIPAILVANATAEVRDQAQKLAQLHGNETQLYLASGGYLGMNGHYAAGILEGISHFFSKFSL